MVVACCRRSGKGASSAIAPFQIVRRAAISQRISTRRLSYDHSLPLKATAFRSRAFYERPLPIGWTSIRWQSSVANIRLNLTPESRKLSFDERESLDSEPFDDEQIDQTPNSFDQSQGSLVATNKHLRFPNGRTWHNKQGKAFSETQEALKTDSLGRPTKVIILKEGECGEFEAQSQSFPRLEINQTETNNVVDDDQALTVLVADGVNSGSQSDVNTTIHELRPKTLEGQLDPVIEKAEYKRLEKMLARAFTSGQLKSYMQWFKSTHSGKHVSTPVDNTEKQNVQEQGDAEVVDEMKTSSSSESISSNLPSQWRWFWPKGKRTGKSEVLHILLRNVWKVSTTEDHLELGHAKRQLQVLYHKILNQGEPSIIQLVGRQYRTSVAFSDSTLFIHGRRTQVEHAAQALDAYIENITTTKLEPLTHDTKFQLWKQDAIYQHTRTIPSSSGAGKKKTTKYFLSGLKPHVEEAKKLLSYDRHFSKPWLRETTFAVSQGKDLKSLMKLVPFSFQSSRIPLHLRLANSKLMRFCLPVDKYAKPKFLERPDLMNPDQTAKQPSTNYVEMRRKGRRLKFFLQEVDKHKPPAFNGVGIWQQNLKTDFTATLGTILLEDTDDTLDQTNFDGALNDKSTFLPGGISFQMLGKAETYPQHDRQEVVRFLFAPHFEDLKKYRLPELVLDFEEPLSTRLLGTSQDNQALSASPKLVNIYARYPKNILDISIATSIADVRIGTRHYVRAEVEKLQDDKSGLLDLVTQITQNFNKPNLGGNLSPLISFPVIFPRLVLKKKTLQWFNPEDQELEEQQSTKLEKPIRYVLTGLEKRKVIQFTNEETGENIKYEHVAVDGGELRGRWSGYKVKLPVVDSEANENGNTLDMETEEVQGFMKGVELLLREANNSKESRSSFISRDMND